MTIIYQSTVIPQMSHGGGIGRWELYVCLNVASRCRPSLKRFMLQRRLDIQRDIGFDACNMEYTSFVLPTEIENSLLDKSSKVFYMNKRLASYHNNIAFGFTWKGADVAAVPAPISKSFPIGDPVTRFLRGSFSCSLGMKRNFCFINDATKRPPRTNIAPAT